MRTLKITSTHNSKRGALTSYRWVGRPPLSPDELQKIGPQARKWAAEVLLHSISIIPDLSMLTHTALSKSWTYGDGEKTLMTRGPYGVTRYVLAGRSTRSFIWPSHVVGVCNGTIRPFAISCNGRTGSRERLKSVEWSAFQQVRVSEDLFLTGAR